jgi:hypothetical protein
MTEFWVLKCGGYDTSHFGHDFKNLTLLSLFPSKVSQKGLSSRETSLGCDGDENTFEVAELLLFIVTQAYLR